MHIKTRDDNDENDKNYDRRLLKKKKEEKQKPRIKNYTKNSFFFNDKTGYQELSYVSTIINYAYMII